ncbi:MAG: DUF456 domain-containing protein [Syntrophomonadaceae bacterium]|nr:DUF456 domain-containing protein [Syntrophomonadaceae bacterium]
MAYDILILIGVIIIMVIGVAGTIIPLLPGIPMVFLSIAFYGWYYDFKVIDLTYLLILLLVTVFSLILDYLSSVLGAKYFASSKAGIWGALLGALLGVFVFPPVGIFVGPWIGAFIGEYIECHDIKRAVKVGTGSFVGLLSGMVIKMIIAVGMAVSFLVKVF